MTIQKLRLCARTHIECTAQPSHSTNKYDYEGVVSSSLSKSSCTFLFFTFPLVRLFFSSLIHFMFNKILYFICGNSMRWLAIDVKIHWSHIHIQLISWRLKIGLSHIDSTTMCENSNETNENHQGAVCFV